MNIKKNTAKEQFISSLEEFRLDPFFCIPEKTREIISKFDKETKFIILGSTDFSATAISGINKSQKGKTLWVVDDFRSNKGDEFCGVEIISTDRFIDIAKKDHEIIAINGCRNDKSKRFFDEICRLHDIPHINYEQINRILSLNEFIDHRVSDWGKEISKNSEKIFKLENLLADDFSKETLFRVLTFHLTCEPEWYLNVARPYSTLYFRSGLLKFNENEKFVDCGASIGESTYGLLSTTKGNLGHSWMIEPDKFNITTLRKFINKYKNSSIYKKISLHQYALGDSENKAPFIHMGGHGGSICSSPDIKSEYVDIMPIDKIIDDLPTFIKMDIEGYELPALKGAKKSISEAYPKLAVSAYHRPTDLIDIPEYIESIAPGYKIGLRHHTEDRWDTCLYFYQ